MSLHKQWWAPREYSAPDKYSIPDSHGRLLYIFYVVPEQYSAVLQMNTVCTVIGRYRYLFIQSVGLLFVHSSRHRA
jgi:hypothetical protein